MKRFAYNVGKLINKCIRDDIFGKSASVSFYILTTFFPFIILIFIIASSISLQMEDMLYGILNLFPHEIADMVLGILNNISRSKGLITTSLIMSAWTMSAAMVSITKSLNSFYSINESRNIISLRITCLVYAIMLIVSIAFIFTLIIFGGVIGDLIHKYITHFDAQTIWNFTRFILVLAYVWALFLLVYKFMPNKKIKLKNVMLGAVFTTLTWIGASFGFSFYVSNFAKYHIIYGSIGGVILLVTWIYITSFLILLGGEINSVYEKMLKTLKKAK